MKCTERLCRNITQHNTSVHSLPPLWYTKTKNGGKQYYKKELIEKLRQQYIQNPPEGMTPKDIQYMDDDNLLDMEYFLHEDDDLEDNFVEEGFYIF